MRVKNDQGGVHSDPVPPQLLPSLTYFISHTNLSHRLLHFEAHSSGCTLTYKQQQLDHVKFHGPDHEIIHMVFILKYISSVRLLNLEKKKNLIWGGGGGGGVLRSVKLTSHSYTSYIQTLPNAQLYWTSCIFPNISPPPLPSL